MIRILTFLTISGLAACGGKSSSTTPSTLITPGDPVLADLYASSCKSCHTRGIGGAPLTGDTHAWGPRLNKGMDTLLDNTINGYRGMPPLGSCSDCSEADFRALISFMSSAPPNTENTGQ